ncbi:alpha/beta fold hydrolase [Pseudoxanthomonas daejeonensis]|uniref:alpha/beta fold hydrolase n=1 Tax=Pseudoxanthomonas daejeonensis TaxID=266062 RepID=UPI001F543E36|nr:alpha/beta fold hydrolase [Pseudoxanthomonas daejeonensis]UNK57488.1 alpha/beta fold hydrolase [Pseudoxanthomonas daejeonensis]
MELKAAVVAPHAHRVVRIACAWFLLLAAGVAHARPDAPSGEDPQRLPPVQGECVVLLHGLGRTHRSMARIDWMLRDAGYATANIDYPSQSQTIEASARTAIPQGVRECRDAGAQRIHFVTHSMGGLLLRYYLGNDPVAGLGRVVMLGPPNQGSEVADALVGTTLYDRVNGPAGAQLVTGPGGIAARLGPAEFPLGIIAGNEQTAFDSVLATRIVGENDGKVAVERAKVDGMADFLVLPVNHTFMVVNDVVIGQVLEFLRHGRFLHEEAATPAAPAG